MRFLLVTYYYAPLSNPGANRWIAMTKYLRRLGHEVTVVTATPADPGVSERADVIRVPSLDANPTVRKLLRRPPALQGSAVNPVVARTPPLLNKVIVPDASLVTWNPWAGRALSQTLRDRAIDCLITTAPPDSTHLLGLMLGRRRPAWIADFRDGWLFQSLRDPFPTPPQRALDAWLERKTATTADVVVGVTRPIADDFGSRLAARAEPIYNGWDPDLAGDPASVEDLVDRRKFRFVYTGTLSFLDAEASGGARRRDPRPLLEAFQALIDADPSLADRVEVIVAGAAAQDDVARMQAPSFRGLVRYAGVLDRSTVLALQRASGALLLLTSDHSSEATGKLFEYLGSGRPIIVLGENNEAARIVRETGTGVSVSPSDVDAIAAQLRRAISGELESGYAPHGLEHFSYPGVAQLMVEAAEKAVSRRSHGHGMKQVSPAQQAVEHERQREGQRAQTHRDA